MSSWRFQLGTGVNRALESLHGGSLKITLSDELLGGKCQQRESKNVFMKSYTSVRTRKLFRIKVSWVLLFTKLSILYLKRFSTDLSPGANTRGGGICGLAPPWSMLFMVSKGFQAQNECCALPRERKNVRLHVRPFICLFLNIKMFMILF